MCLLFWYGEFQASQDSIVRYCLEYRSRSASAWVDAEPLVTQLSLLYYWEHCGAHCGLVRLSVTIPDAYVCFYTHILCSSWEH